MSDGKEGNDFCSLESGNMSNEDEMLESDTRIVRDGKLSKPPVYKNDEEEVEDELPIPADVYNTKPLSYMSDTYELEKFHSNIALVFNQIKVIGYNTARTYSHIDYASLKTVLSLYRFNVTPHLDYKKYEIFQTLDACEFLF